MIEIPPSPHSTNLFSFRHCEAASAVAIQIPAHTLALHRFRASLDCFVEDSSQ